MGAVQSTSCRGTGLYRFESEISIFGAKLTSSLQSLYLIQSTHNVHTEQQYSKKKN